MTAVRTVESRPCVAVFDLDGTLTWRDTLMPYLLGFARHRPTRLLRLWRLGPAVAGYLAARCDRGVLKSRLIRAVLGADSRTDIDAWSAVFVAGMQRAGMFRAVALEVLQRHRSAGDHLILMSASPDLYVLRLGTLLGFERIVCTELAWRRTPTGEERLNGELLTRNRRGEEKSRCLAWVRTLYPGVPIVAYGNSGSDLPHMRLAERALLVNAGPRARREAAMAGIPTANWS